MKTVGKLVATSLVAGACVWASGVEANAATLDTEIASAGGSVALEEYCEASDANKPEAEIATIIEKSVQAVKEEHSIFKDVCIAKVEADGYVNVRKNPNTEAKVVGKIFGNCGGDIIKEKDGWYKIKSGNVKGWVKAEFFVTGEDAKDYAVDNGYVLATVKESGLRVRKKQSKKADVISNVYKEETYAVTKYGKTDNWIKLGIDEGVEGWVSTEYIDLKIGYEPAITLAEEKAMLQAQAEKEAEEEASRQASIAASEAAEEAETATEATTAATQTYQESKEMTTVYQQTTKQQTTAAQVEDNVSYDSATGSAVIAYAKQFLGNPYVYGGSSLTNGTDCSGFTMSIYAHFGYSLPRTSSAQRSAGVGVSLNAVQPGDIICYNGHVALYIGGGQIIHASTPSTGIIISSMYYGSNPICARRIIR
ncbi:C40 family peptidase [Eubacterium sp.]|uniref:C40 family peptidase n=1 Tax=Eubacterium sp. TaxID=142586 RepID=UPI0025D91791|nr:C40 family peptidase [Eubacterium sp.]MCR5628453.1 C40 family peptidase [Eubacterium sp.]